MSFILGLFMFYLFGTNIVNSYEKEEIIYTDNIYFEIRATDNVYNEDSFLLKFKFPQSRVASISSIYPTEIGCKDTDEFGDYDSDTLCVIIYTNKNSISNTLLIGRLETYGVNPLNEVEFTSLGNNSKPIIIPKYERDFQNARGNSLIRIIDPLENSSNEDPIVFELIYFAIGAFLFLLPIAYLNNKNSDVNIVEKRGNIFSSILVILLGILSILIGVIIERQSLLPVESSAGSYLKNKIDYFELYFTYKIDEDTLSFKQIKSVNGYFPSSVIPDNKAFSIEILDNKGISLFEKFIDTPMKSYYHPPTRRRSP